MLHDPAARAKPITTESITTGPITTGLETECLRQAVHDLRNRLNATSILLHVAAATAGRDGAAAATGKLSQAVQELQTLGRLLDQLVAASDSVALEFVPIDLRATVADALRSGDASARGVSVHVDALDHATNLVLSCPIRLPRVLTVILDRCIAALPDGGEIRFTIDHGSEQVRLLTTASGPRVVIPAPGASAFELNDGSAPGGCWFPIKALVRGLRGDVRVSQEDGRSVRVEVELPRGDRSGRGPFPSRNH